MKKAQVMENSTASSEWNNTLAANQLGIIYAGSLSEQNMEENDDECHDESGKIQYVQDFYMLPANQQDDFFITILRKDCEESLWNQTSQLHFQEDEQYFSANHQIDSILMNPTSKPEQEQGQSCNEGSSQRGQKLESISLQGTNKTGKNAQSKNLQKKFKKNVNVPKAIGRYLMDYHHLFEKSIFQHQQHYFQQLSRKLKDLKAWVRKSKKNSFKLTHLNDFFSAGQDKRHSSLNRLMMRKILHKCLRNEIIPNNQVKDKLEYLVASKVFSLRCTNSKLSTRMQMH